MKFTIDELVSKLPLPADGKWTEGVWDLEPFKRGGITLVFFAPRGKDHQTYHDEDEIYFIARGSAQLIIDGEPFPCEVGDAFFVPAGKTHHFQNISDEFASWAVFF